MERLVEDLIMESMQKGEFDNLPGFGKPLPQRDTNPYLDGMTQKLNRILVQQGFSPEWVILEKEIRDEIRRIRKWLGRIREDFPDRLSDLDRKERAIWDKSLLQLQSDCEATNKRINHYNLVVPILSRQMAHLNYNRELKRVEKKVLEKGQEEAQPNFASE